jgi:hypothetical protein
MIEDVKLSGSTLYGQIFLWTMAVMTDKRQTPFEILAARTREIFRKNRIDPEVKFLSSCPAALPSGVVLSKRLTLNGTLLLLDVLLRIFMQAVVQEDWNKPSRAEQDSFIGQS